MQFHLNSRDKILFFTISFLFSLSISCDHEKLAEIEPIKIKRFDLDLLKFDTAQFEVSEKKMIQLHGEIYPFYIEKLMGLGSIDPNNSYYYKPHLTRFLRGEYPAMMDTMNQLVTGDIDKFENELTQSYQNLCTYFPAKKPSVVYSFFISPMGSNPAAAFSFGQDTVGINWFNYLGKDFSMYKPLYEGYNYMVEWNQPEYLTRNVMLVEYNLLYEKYKTTEEYSELIYNMIEKGKEFYYLDKVCPDMKDHIKIGYSVAQDKWCKENEFEIWAFFKENKVLYSIETMDIKRMTEQGPTTPGMPSESPGMVGAWVGWQIVKAYQARENKSLQELIQTSPKEIMKSANYKPKK
jgi:hypothetical protein